MVIIYCVVRLAQDAHLSQSEIVYWGRGRMGYVARWQEEVVYGIFILLCGSIIIYALRTGAAAKSEDEHDNI